MIDSKLYTDPLITGMRRAVEKAVEDHNNKMIQNMATFLRMAQTRNNAFQEIVAAGMAGVGPGAVKLWLDELNKYTNWWAREKGFAPKADAKPGSEKKEKVA